MRKLLNCTSRMMFALGIQVRLMSRFGRQIISKPLSFVVNCNVCPPFVLKPNHAKKSGFIAPVWFPNVLRIAISGYNSQIAQPVVIFSPVDVVNKAIRPFAVRVQPSKSVGFINFAFNAYRNVSKLVRIARSIANLYRFARTNNPCKDASVFVIREHLAKFICGDVGFGHFAAPVKAQS